MSLQKIFRYALTCCFHCARNSIYALGKRKVSNSGEWVLGHTSIVESALSEYDFAMDFRLTHPIFGQVFRYAGIFATQVRQP